jgi:hypothetical protein
VTCSDVHVIMENSVCTLQGKKSWCTNMTQMCSLNCVFIFNFTYLKLPWPFVFHLNVQVQVVAGTILYGDLGEIVCLESLTSPCDDLREKLKLS